MSQSAEPLRAIWRGANRLRSRIRRTLETELSYHRLEQRWLDLSFWRPRKRFERKVSLVFKAKSTSDHFLPAILSYIKAGYRDVGYLSFSRDERPRDDPGRASAKFYRYIEHNHPDIVFAYDSPLSVEEVHYLADRGISIASTAVGLDSFYIGGAPTQRSAIEALQRYAWYFVGHRPHVQPLRDLGIQAYHMTWGYDPRWFRPLSGVEPRYDVLFVGDIDYPMNANRRDMLTHVARYFKVAILSYRPPDIDGVLHLGTETNPRRLNRLLNESRIVLGSDRVSNHDKINVLPEQFIFYQDEFLIRARTYLTIGSGACYMVERHPEIMRQFEDGREIVLWNDYDELCHHIDYYLKHDVERRAIGLAGHQRALADHAITTVMRSAFQIMGLLREE